MPKLLGPLVTPVRVDRALGRVRDIFVDACSLLIADPKRFVLGTDVGGTPRRARPYVHISALTLPAMVGTFTDEKVTRLAIDSKTIQILSADATAEYKLRLNGLPATYTEDGTTETIEEIRNAWIDVIDALGEPVTVAPASTDSISITPNITGAIYSLTSPSPAARLTVDEVIGTDVVTYSTGRRRFTIRVQCFSKNGRVGSGGAHEVINLAYAALDTPDAKLFLKDNRLSVRPISEPVNLTGLVGSEARNEQRASFDAVIFLASQTVRPANAIETVEFELTLGDSVITFSQDATTAP